MLTGRFPALLRNQRIRADSVENGDASSNTWCGIRGSNPLFATYECQLKTTLNRFVLGFLGKILDATSQKIDAWLRLLDVAAHGTRQNAWMTGMRKDVGSHTPSKPDCWK